MILTFYLVAFIHNITQHRSVLRFPSDEDLNGAAVALMRLQDTYMLDTHALAEGELLGKKYSRQLSGKRIFFLFEFIIIFFSPLNASQCFVH